MADGLNKIMLLGNLGADPELRISGGGTAVLKLRLATAESFLDAQKQRQERTEWHSVVLFGKRAEALAKILKKGSRLFVEGGNRTTSYDKDGEKRYRTEVVASNIILCGGEGGGRSGGGSRGGGGGADYGPAGGDPVGDFGGVPDDDIPF